MPNAWHTEGALGDMDGGGADDSWIPVVSLPMWTSRILQTPNAWHTERALGNMDDGDADDSDY